MESKLEQTDTKADLEHVRVEVDMKAIKESMATKEDTANSRELLRKELSGKIKWSAGITIALIGAFISLANFL